MTILEEGVFHSDSCLTAISIPNSVTSIGDYAFVYCRDLSSVNIPNSVTKINKSTFYGCSSLTAINIPSSITSIGDHAFRYCSGLSKVVIPSSVTSIGFCAFYDCSGLSAVSIPNSVQKIGDYAFRGCSSLSTVAIPNSVDSIGKYAFAACDELTKVTLSNKLKCLEEGVFYSDSCLTAISIPNSVTSIGDYAFVYCRDLSSVNIPNSVTKINKSTFYGCSSLTAINIPSSITTIGDYAFRYCSGLSAVSIPNSVQKIGDYAFRGCSSLSTVAIPNSVDSIGKWAFADCEGLTKITLSNKLKYLEEGVFYGNSSLTSISIPSTVTTIGDGAFCACSVLSSVTIPKSVTNIGRWAFQDCAKLSSINIPNSVITIDYSAFYNCSNLTEVNIPNSVSTIADYAFRGCSSLSTVAIPNSVDSIGKYAFAGCDGLTKITLPNKLTILEKGVFYGDSSLTSISIPNSVTNIGNWSFGWCTALTNIDFSNSLESIGEQAFDSCTSLKKVYLPNSLKTLNNHAFYECSNLKDISLPSSLTTIGDSVFLDCPKLWTVRINSNAITSKTYTSSANLKNIFGNQVKEYIFGDSVRSIGNYAFNNCTGMTSVTIPYSLSNIKNAAFSGCENLTTVNLNSDAVVSEYYSSYSGIKNIFGAQVKEYILGDSVKSIGQYAFHDCTGLTSITLPETLKYIGYGAFSGCTELSSIIIPNTVTYIGYSSFSSNTKIFATKGKASVLALWRAGYAPYDVNTDKQLLKPSLSAENTTQSTATLKFNNYESSYTFKIGDDVVSNPNKIKFTGLCPESNISRDLYAAVKGSEDWYYLNDCNFRTADISPRFALTSRTASSVTLTPSFIKGDAKVTEQKMEIGWLADQVQEAKAGKTTTFIGLNPNKDYYIRYTITANGYPLSYSIYAKTDALHLETQKPKVVSAGNVIVAAEANVDEDEENVGFEWRRTDWEDDFESNTGTAVVFDGMMEGYIKDLYKDKLWRHRPFYEAADGTRYYGDWVGIDPVNTSYFDPTVHTYSKTNVKNNTAQLKGYAMQGSDNVISQGFKYWKTQFSARSIGEKAYSVPSYAQTVEATGQVMTVNLMNLDFNSTYSYVAFVTTSEGTFYGEEQTFSIGEDLTGIGQVQTTVREEDNTFDVYNLSGQKVRSKATSLEGLPKGIYVVNRKKVYVK